MKPFHEKYPNFISRKYQIIKLSERSWRFSAVPDFKRNFILAMRDDVIVTDTKIESRIIISKIINRFYNQHL